MKKGTKHSDETRAKIGEKARQRGKLSDAHRRQVIRTLLFGKKAIGPKNPGWKGGKSLHDGYVMIRMPSHQKAYANGYIKRAVLVAEKKLGRPLFKGEVTHHINGVKDDDRPENIEVLDAAAHNTVTAKERWLSGEMHQYHRKGRA